MSFVRQQIEFAHPLTPLLIAVVREIKRLEQEADIEALDALVDVIRPFLKRNGPTYKNNGAAT